MAQDWAADVRKYAADADDGVIAGIVRYCGIALRNRDSALVSFGDPAELARVRNNFLKKKLALPHADDALDAAIATVGERMKGDRTRNRVTVYYLLAEHFGKLDDFAKKAQTKGGMAKSLARKAEPNTARPAAAKEAANDTGVTAPGAPAPSAAASPVAASSAAPVGTPGTSPATAPQQLASASTAAVPDESGFGWLWWLLLVLLVIFVLWWLFAR